MAPASPNRPSQKRDAALVRDFAAIVLAAGMGTRMRSDLPKVLHEVAGRSLLGHVLDSLDRIGCGRTVVVVGPDMPAVEAVAVGRQIAIQSERRGTGHAAAMAREALAGFAGPILILYGDVPLIRPETLERLLDAVPTRPIAMLGFRPADPTGYGRVLKTPDGLAGRIVEQKDASDEERRIDLCNAGIYAVEGARLFGLLDRLTADNAQGELYLTDIVAHAGGAVVIEAPAAEVQGVNSRLDLAEVEAEMQRRLRRAALEGGTTLRDPGTVYLSVDTRFGRDVVVGQHVVFGPGVTLGDRVEIRPFTHIEGATIQAGATVGPFSRLRPGAELGADVHVGNFVEIKASRLEAGVKAGHLAYIGDATVGAGTNIGAGTITANYDGYSKNRTVIGEGAFIGSNSTLVAPVSVGKGALVAAGSTITKPVAENELAVARGMQKGVPDGAARYRARRRKD